MEQQVAEAARAMVRPDTDATTRAAASAFLEEFTTRSEAWSIYATWLASFVVTSDDFEAAGMQLLCLQLLQAKIRREVPRGKVSAETHLPLVLQIQGELGKFLQQGPTGAAASSACTCLVALAIRCGGLSELVRTCCQSVTNELSPPIVLKLVGCIPREMEACSDLRTPEVTAELWPFLEPVLEFLRRALLADSAETVSPALDTLKEWVVTTRTSLTILNTPTCGGTESILPVLIHLLSQSQVGDESILVQASRALTEAVLVPTDSCTDSRNAACQMMFSAIVSQGFVVDPLRQASAQEWDDAYHALATFISTLVTEEIDKLVSQPADPLLQLLLEIQKHRHPKTRMTVLECWLTVQEVSTSERHNNWKAPLFYHVVEALLIATEYPANFVDWNQEVDLDQSEFDEFRRMVKDVYASAYFLLRGDFLQRMAIQITSTTSWQAQEAALFALVAVAREVCGRCKAQSGGTSISKDRERTVEQLLQFVHHLCGPDPSTVRHSLLLTGTAQFVGAYAPTWAVRCTPDAVLQLLVYLNSLLGSAAVLDAAKAIRSLLVSCSAVLLSNPALQGKLLEQLREITSNVILTNNEDAMTLVTEGNTRLVAQMNDNTMKQQALSNLVEAVLHRSEMALNTIPSDGSIATPEAVAAVEALAMYLHIFQVLIRFCDGGTSVENPVAYIMTAICPFLEKVSSHRASQCEAVMVGLIAIHEQLLRNCPELVAPYFQNTITYVVQALEQTKHPRTLGYISSAVEGFGSAHVESFQELLGHVATIIFAYISAEKRIEECTDIIRGFFELNQRYILYCPSALVRCSQFASIVSCATECLVSLKGERESTRATLNFLAQLFGWRSLRVSSESLSALQGASPIIDEQVGLHGARIAQVCMATLLGGPQMLWPSCTDCLFAVVSSTITWPVPEDPESTMAQQWMVHANPDATQSEVYQQVVRILLNLARDGTKNKPKAKMLLTDYCKIYKQEMTADALVAYSLP